MNVLYLGANVPASSLEAAIAGQQEFAELHAKHWPECEMVATLRQISEAPPEAADA